MFSIADHLRFRRVRKTFKDLRGQFRLYEDILPEETRTALKERFQDVQDAIANRERDDLTSVVEVLREELEAALPKRRWGVWEEWFDVIVSALAVAFCFRAYYYEPFRIPTGSMQPTLYGIHSEAADPTFWDAAPLRYLKFLVTGASYQEVRIRNGGRLTGVGRDARTPPGCVSIIVNHRDRYEVPDDVATQLRDEGRLAEGATAFKRGERLWHGYVKSGDFLFVNRWIWNFRHPRLGETIIFSTRGIGGGLPDNQHYIKRLCGRPGDTVDLKPGDPYLYVNGERAIKPDRLEEIARRTAPWEGAPKYPGYAPAQPNGIHETQSHFELGPGEYLALGDNSGNSLDSRYWGKVPAENLLGPATFVHWPFTSPRWGNIR